MLLHVRVHILLSFAFCFDFILVFLFHCKYFLYYSQTILVVYHIYFSDGLFLLFFVWQSKGNFQHPLIRPHHLQYKSFVFLATIDAKKIIEVSKNIVLFFKITQKLSK